MPADKSAKSEPPLSVNEAFEACVAAISNNATKQLKSLLETKHLYQRTMIDGEDIVSSYRKRAIPSSDFDRKWTRTISTFYPGTADEATTIDRSGAIVPLLHLTFLHVRLFCNQCDRKEAFKPIWIQDAINESRKIKVGPGGYAPTTIPPTFQMIYVLYQCQNCLGLPEAFLIRRDNWCLSLEGRSPLEHVELPNYIPKKERDWYRDAVIAMNAGKTLAALFYLRTFIEQFARRITKTDGKVSGSEIMTSYADTLPLQHRNSMPSLRDWYDRISACLHGALEDAEVFKEAREQIDRHFDIRRVFNIPE